MVPVANIPGTTFVPGESRLPFVSVSEPSEDPEQLASRELPLPRRKPPAERADAPSEPRWEPFSPPPERFAAQQDRLSAAGQQWPGADPPFSGTGRSGTSDGGVRGPGAPLAGFEPPPRFGAPLPTAAKAVTRTAMHQRHCTSRPSRCRDAASHSPSGASHCHDAAKQCPSRPNRSPTAASRCPRPNRSRTAATRCRSVAVSFRSVLTRCPGVRPQPRGPAGTAARTG